MYPPPGHNLFKYKKDRCNVIVEINGQQFKAEEGKKLFVHHIQNAESGAVVEFEKSVVS